MRTRTGRCILAKVTWRLVPSLSPFHRIDPPGVPSFHWICYSSVLIIYCEASQPPVSIVSGEVPAGAWLVGRKGNLSVGLQYEEEEDEVVRMRDTPYHATLFMKKRKMRLLG